ncbi:NAD(P)-dependent dehydrogenase (short-subunit alcohol dehydrogenase family) [Algoriphagus iocasae]|uniref:NAD(P)-dependent dehydrogenase (Short-subunit alcohol dehydrogenase family) n=1 Tax=Algoriphagus iocasae TaxID=1836499 RepID=A0A841ML30_9BACT|nr:SDR family oxidoreductase [Algoriphagus iocasae]MBB6324946.1 NAD(P)-dependent dehydrogenase (short-subunit alcohol dehydrogenase family) [Algoriphagus iocasae]
MKNILIIGASSGIGKALANSLSKNGNQVFGTYNQTLVESSENINFIQFDVLDSELDLSFLPEKLDGLVYCPGSINLKPFARIKAEDFLSDYSLQVVGAIQVIQKVLPLLKASENASIVLFSTVAVQKGFNFHAQVAASKGAIEGLTRSLAAEFAPSIRVNAIAPSITDTPLASKLLASEEKKEANAQRHPLKKIGSPEDIAEMAAFLLSDQSSWMTGQILHVDGGMSSIN